MRVLAVVADGTLVAWSDWNTAGSTEEPTLAKRVSARSRTYPETILARWRGGQEL